MTVAPGIELGQARKQERHARDVAVVLTGLVGAAEKDLVDFLGKAGMTAYQLADGQGGEIISSQAGERAAVAADRSARVVADEGFFGHGRTVRRFGLNCDSVIVASIGQCLI